MTIKKELLLLVRDIGGLVILFVMPIFLVISVTLIQNNTYENITNKKMDILLVDLDKGDISSKLIDEVEQAGIFELKKEINNVPLTEDIVKDEVRKGQYQLAIVIPANLSNSLNERINNNVEQIVAQFIDGSATPTAPTEITAKEVRLYFDPALQTSFKEGIKGAIDKIVVTIENKAIYKAFADQLIEGDDPSLNKLFEQQSLIQFKEITPQESEFAVIPNAVQHNVPAWSLFAIFFIMLPLAMNIVKEKNQGISVRLYTMPTGSFILYCGKVLTYLMICMLQFYTILLVGKYIFPLIGLVSFDFEGKLLLLSIVTFFVASVAVSLGILLGSIAKTQEQSAPFGATFVVILAAISGVWVPVFAMPTIMQYIAKLSPMNWALNGYYTILLREGGILEIATDLILLILFSTVILTTALLYDKKKRSM